MIRSTENMGVVLDEPPDPGQTAQRTARLVPVQHTKLGHPQGQFLVTPLPRVKDQAVSGTVHRLDSKLLLVHRKTEHVVGIVLPVARSLPEFRVVNVGRTDLDIAPLVVFALTGNATRAISRASSLSYLGDPSPTRINSINVL